MTGSLDALRSSDDVDLHLDSGADGGAQDADDEAYRLVSIDTVRAPAGCAGRDWFVYRIAQGGNAITGYRQGSRDKVGTEVETLVAALNGRRQWTKRKPDPKTARRAAAARRKAAAAE
jgi:hypothetical protein